MAFLTWSEKRVGSWKLEAGRDPDWGLRSRTIQVRTQHIIGPCGDRYTVVFITLRPRTPIQRLTCVSMCKLPRSSLGHAGACGDFFGPQKNVGLKTASLREILWASELSDWTDIWIQYPSDSVEIATDIIIATQQDLSGEAVAERSTWILDRGLCRVPIAWFVR